MEMYLPILVLLIASLTLQPTVWLVKHARQPDRQKLHSRADTVPDDRC